MSIRTNGKRPLPALMDRALRILVLSDDRAPTVTIAATPRLRTHYRRMRAGSFDGLDLSADFRPHVMIVNSSAFKTAGVTLAKQLREHAVLRNVVLIALTDVPEAELDGSERARVFFFKPTDVRSIQRILASIASSTAHAPNF